MSAINLKLHMQMEIDLHVDRKGTRVFEVGYEEANDKEKANNTKGTSNSSHDINSSHYICPICLTIVRDPNEVNCWKNSSMKNIWQLTGCN